MQEQSAKGVKGHLLYNPFTKEYFFRVYNQEDKNKYKDYDIAAEDVEIEILSNWVALYEDERKLGWSSKALGKDL